MSRGNFSLREWWDAGTGCPESYGCLIPDVFKVRLFGALGSLLWWVAALLLAAGLDPLMDTGMQGPAPQHLRDLGRWGGESRIQKVSAPSPDGKIISISVFKSLSLRSFRDVWDKACAQCFFVTVDWYFQINDSICIQTTFSNQLY